MGAGFCPPPSYNQATSAPQMYPNPNAPDPHSKEAMAGMTGGMQRMNFGQGNGVPDYY